MLARNLEMNVKKSVKLVKSVYAGDRILGVLTQENRKVEEPGFNDLYTVGTVAKILKMLVLPDGNTTIIIKQYNYFI